MLFYSEASGPFTLRQIVWLFRLDRPIVSNFLAPNSQQTHFGGSLQLGGTVFGEQISCYHKTKSKL